MSEVLFVSKPIAPPFHDGSKCLVRDVARHLRQVEPVLMSTAEAPVLTRAMDGTRIKSLAVYDTSGGFAPAASENLRVAAWLLFRAREKIWHFVFAPNPRSSRMARLLSRLRRVGVLQTIASPPRSFDDIETLLFGDIVVAQSQWTRARVVAAYDEAGRSKQRRPRVEVIPPPVDQLEPRSLESHLAIRQALGIGEQVPLFVYPGDLETSSGARSVAAAAPLLAKQLGAVTVFAYRKKSPRAIDIARSLEQELGPVARFTHSVPDVLALIAGSSGILFPVDDLWGKVDLPIVLLESMALGVPVVALDWGPLSDLGAVHFVRSADPASLLSAAARLIRDADYRTDLIRRQKSEVERRFSAPVVAERYERLYLELLASADA